MNDESQLLGMVHNGRFHCLWPASSPMRLTAIAMQEAVPPDSRELDLSKYEGEAIMVQGRASSGWVYSAAVIDRAGPILSLLVQKEFSVEEKPSTRRAKGTPEKGTK